MYVCVYIYIYIYIHTYYRHKMAMSGRRWNRKPPTPDPGNLVNWSF